MLCLIHQQFLYGHNNQPPVNSVELTDENLKFVEFEVSFLCLPPNSFKGCNGTFRVSAVSGGDQRREPSWYAFLMDSGFVRNDRTSWVHSQLESVALVMVLLNYSALFTCNMVWEFWATESTCCVLGSKVERDRYVPGVEACLPEKWQRHGIVTRSERRWQN